VDEWNEYTKAYSEAIDMPPNQLQVIGPDKIILNGKSIPQLNTQGVDTLNMLMLSYGSNAFSFVQARQYHGYRFGSSKDQRRIDEEKLHSQLVFFFEEGMIGYNDPENHRGIFLLPTHMI
jgi:hypothetical protein